MATTSPNFGLILATTSDAVSVTTHIAGNFSSLDTILSAVHTGTGQLKTGLTFVSPTLNTPVMSGTVSGAAIVIATTGSFQTITATGGAVTVNTFNIGSYSYPSVIGSTSNILTVVTGNAQWAASAPNTGANQALSNLAVVAINTNMNTFTGGFVTVARVIATSGALTGLTSFQATAGTFAGLLTVLGTVTANVVNCTGGAITAGGITIGTWALPTTVGATGQILSVTTGNGVWIANSGATRFSGIGVMQSVAVSGQSTNHGYLAVIGATNTATGAGFAIYIGSSTATSLVQDAFIRPGGGGEIRLSAGVLLPNSWFWNIVTSPAGGLFVSTLTVNFIPISTS